MIIDKNYKTSSSKIGRFGKIVTAGIFYGLYSIFGGNYSAQAGELKEKKALRLEAMADNAYKSMKSAGATSQELSEVRKYQKITDKAVLGVFNKYLQQGETALAKEDYNSARQNYNSAKGIIKKKYTESLKLVSEKQKSLNKLIKEKKKTARELVNKLRAGLNANQDNPNLDNNYTGKTLGDLLGTDKFGDETYVPAFMVSKDWVGDSKWKLAEAVNYKINGKTGKFTDATLEELNKLMGGFVKYIETGKNSETGKNFADATFIFNEDVPVRSNIRKEKGLVSATTIGDGSNVYIKDGKGEIIGYQWFPEKEKHDVFEIKLGKPGFFGSNLWTPAKMKYDLLENILSRLELTNTSAIFYWDNKNGDEYVNPGEITFGILRPESEVEVLTKKFRGKKISYVNKISLNEPVKIKPIKKIIRLGKSLLSLGPGTKEEGGGDGDGDGPGGGVGPK